MNELLHHVFEHLAKEHLENLFFYFLSSIVMIAIMIKNDASFRNGLHGTNGLFEAPEIVTYIWVWLFPQVILAVLFLKYEPQEWFWLFMGICLLFALAGRDGIQMLFNWRGSKTTIIEKETSSEKTTKSEQP